MMDNLKILNKKEIKKIYALLEKRFGFNDDLELGFLMNNKNRLYVVNKDFAGIDTEKLRINSVGLYFGEICGNEIRLSIEGSAIVGKSATNNILDLDDEQAKDWLRGFDLNIDYEDKGFVLIRNKDFLGCGKAVIKRILNFVPKNRRIKN